MSLPPHSTPGPPAGKSLRPEHARIVGERIREALGYIGKLQRRMYAVGFVDTDVLMQMVNAAQDGLHRLSVRLHYEAVDRKAS